MGTGEAPILLHRGWGISMLWGSFLDHVHLRRVRLNRVPPCPRLTLWRAGLVGAEERIRPDTLISSSPSPSGKVPCGVFKKN